MVLLDQLFCDFEDLLHFWRKITIFKKAQIQPTLFSRTALESHLKIDKLCNFEVQIFIAFKVTNSCIDSNQDDNCHANSNSFHDSCVQMKYVMNEKNDGCYVNVYI